MKIKYLTIPILLLLCACGKSPTGPETGTLTGTVLLEGQTNHSGITVALYKLAELDTTILRYNREYPNVGFPISQATEFDHRLGEVVAEAKTKQDGSFEIDGVEEGTYNLVAEKAGFGWKYIYHVRIKRGAFLQIGDVMAKNGLGMVQICTEFSNVVNNIPINTGSNTAMNRICNNPMNRLANNGQLGQLRQLKIKNDWQKKYTGKSTRKKLSNGL